MRNLLFVILAAALGWSAYWLWGARATQNDAEAWLAARQADGWQAEAGDIALRGYPNRFDLTLTDVALADPDSGLGWEAPFFQLLRLSYSPQHVIAVWPDMQRLFWPGGGATLNSDAMRASVVLDGSDALDRATLVADVLNVATDAGGAAAFARLQLDARRAQGTTYQMAFTAEGFAPRLPDAISGLPASFDTLRATAQVTFDTEWDIAALRGRRPHPTLVDLTLAEMDWGALGVRATGHLDIGDGGTADGSLSVQVRNWRDAVALMRQSGEVAPQLLSGVEQFLTVMARLKGNSDTLDLTLDVTASRVFLGPMPLGTLPPLEFK